MDTFARYAHTIALLLLVICSFYGGWYVNGARWEARNAELVADYARQQQQAATEALTKQQKLIKDLDNAKRTTMALQEKHDRNVADSRAASERLRIELDRIKALPAVNSSSTIAYRANAATDRLLLANLLGESDERAGAYAEEADRLRVALSACNSEYESVRLGLSN